MSLQDNWTQKKYNSICFNYKTEQYTESGRLVGLPGSARPYSRSEADRTESDLITWFYVYF